MPEITPTRYVVCCGWETVPHLDEKVKRDLLAAYPLHERKARTRGIPGLGAGAIYPLAEEHITCSPFAVPPHWPRVYGMDVGWNCTAVVWGAWDRESDVVYLYTEHYRQQAEPSIHADAIKARGTWIPGVIDPAAGASSQSDGSQLLAMYTALGLRLTKAANARETGILAVWQRLSTGRLKVFSTCANFLSEYRFYRRDAAGKVVKDHDHALDACRYMVMSGLSVAAIKSSGVSLGGHQVADNVAGY